jgi:hypothetical protein
LDELVRDQERLRDIDFIEEKNLFRKSTNKINTPRKRYKLVVLGMISFARPRKVHRGIHEWTLLLGL